jgi:hypothetical protein
MAAPKKLTQARLKELLHYDPETGVFTRLVSRNGNNALIGSRAGTPNSHGYTLIQIRGTKHRAHRLAFLYMTGEIPPEVDHINRVKDDNRWDNLRPATKRENQGNVGLQSNNTSGHRGVSWDKRRGKWRAEGKYAGRVTHLGYYTSLEEAAAISQAWREKNFGVFAAD